MESLTIPSDEIAGELKTAANILCDVSFFHVHLFYRKHNSFDNKTIAVYNNKEKKYAKYLLETESVDLSKEEVSLDELYELYGKYMPVLCLDLGEKYTNMLSMARDLITAKLSGLI